MAHGFKTGGRQVGTPNRNRTALRERLAPNYPDYDPPAMDLKSRTTKHGPRRHNPQTEVGHGGLPPTFAASLEWGDYRLSAKFRRFGGVNFSEPRHGSQYVCH